MINVVCYQKKDKGMTIMKQTVNKIVTWLQKQVKDANVKGLVVGVSGGLDSAVVAKLIKLACPDDSLGVIMPLKSNPNDLADAKKVIENCQMNHLTIDLTKTHEVLFNSVEEQIKLNNEWNESANQIADANLRARLRMSTLYTIATNYKYLVVGTDNAAEWYTGYFTKYGDGGVDIQPIIDLRKEEVIEMAKYLKLPPSVINKKPSADLWVGQTDEEELGTTYEYIDKFLKGEPIPKQDETIINQIHARTEHKRKIPPHLNLK